jgi:hypothetical protein
MDPFPIYVKTMTGDMICLEPSTSSTTVLDIKKAVQRSFPTFSLALQSIITFNEVDGDILFTEMETAKTVGDYGIKSSIRLAVILTEWFRMPPAPLFLEIAERLECRTDIIAEEIELPLGKIQSFRLMDTNFIHRRQNYNDEYNSLPDNQPDIGIGIYETHKTYMTDLPAGATIKGKVESIQLQMVGSLTKPSGAFIELVHPIEVFVDNEAYEVPGLHTSDFRKVFLYAQTIEEI